MEKKNITFSKDGMKVGVKEMGAEDYEDRTQRFVALEGRHCHVLGTDIKCQSFRQDVELCE